MIPLNQQPRALGLRFSLRITWITTSALLKVLLDLMMGRIKAKIVGRVATTTRLVPPLAVRSDNPRPLTDAEFQRINELGFGDRANTYSWSMRWWRGKLYVGTAREFACVEYHALHTQLPSIQRYPPRHHRYLHCAEVPYDLSLRGEIWCYTPQTMTWKRVYQSPNDISVPGVPTTSIGREIGFRDMTLFTEPDGTEALYLSGVSARTIDRRLPAPRLLRSTDGVTFNAVACGPSELFADPKVVGFRSMTVYRDRLYVVAGVLYGDGVLLESADPMGGSAAWRQISPPGMRVYSLAVFNGYLYLGLRDLLHGYSVVKTDAMGPAPYSFTPIVTNGGFRRPVASHLILSMMVFNDHLYAGTEFPAELIRIHADDRWDLVMGRSRKTPHGKKMPLSSLGDGFGYPLNVALDRMQVHDDWLYVGTNDTTERTRKFALARELMETEAGLDVYATHDGINFVAVTRTGFADRIIGRTRSFASTPIGLFIGTTNRRDGAPVYLGTHQPAKEGSE